MNRKQSIFFTFALCVLLSGLNAASEHPTADHSTMETLLNRLTNGRVEAEQEAIRNFATSLQGDDNTLSDKDIADLVQHILSVNKQSSEYRTNILEHLAKIEHGVTTLDEAKEIVDSIEGIIPQTDLTGGDLAQRNLKVRALYRAIKSLIGKFTRLTVEGAIKVISKRIDTLSEGFVDAISGGTPTAGETLEKYLERVHQERSAEAVAPASKDGSAESTAAEEPDESDMSHLSKVPDDDSDPEEELVEDKETDVFANAVNQYTENHVDTRPEGRKALLNVALALHRKFPDAQADEIIALFAGHTVETPLDKYKEVVNPDNEIGHYELQPYFNLVTGAITESAGNGAAAEKEDTTSETEPDSSESDGVEAAASKEESEPDSESEGPGGYRINDLFGDSTDTESSSSESDSSHISSTAATGSSLTTTAQTPGKIQTGSSTTDSNAADVHAVTSGTAGTPGSAPSAQPTQIVPSQPQQAVTVTTTTPSSTQRLLPNQQQPVAPRKTGWSMGKKAGVAGALVSLIGSTIGLVASYRVAQKHAHVPTRAQVALALDSGLLPNGFSGVTVDQLSWAQRASLSLWRLLKPQTFDTFLSWVKAQNPITDLVDPVSPLLGAQLAGEVGA